MEHIEASYCVRVWKILKLVGQCLDGKISRTDFVWIVGMGKQL
jgi:hypothetical protein